MLGERILRRYDLPITRTVMWLTPTRHQLQGDPGMFTLWAQVIELVVQHLGDDEWDTRYGTSSEEALAFTRRLREQPEPASGASWHVLNVTFSRACDGAARAVRALVERPTGDPRWDQPPRDHGSVRRTRPPTRPMNSAEAASGKSPRRRG